MEDHYKGLLTLQRYLFLCDKVSSRFSPMREVGTMVSLLDPNNLFNQRFKCVFFHWQ